MSIHAHTPKQTAAHGLFEYRTVEKKKLKLTMAITGTMMAAELIGGVLTNSLALISDAGHMFTHFFALTISLIAILLATKKFSRNQTFGLYRIEILSALFNSLFLFGITGWIVYEGIKRILAPQPVLTVQMLVIAIAGLMVNLTSAWILQGASREDLNVRGAFLHMLADTISSVAIIIGAVTIYHTRWFVIDPILSIVIAIVIFKWGWGLLTDSINVLLEGTPKGITPQMIIDLLKEEVPQIQEVVDIHIWEITSKMYSMTAQIQLKEEYGLEQNKSIIHRIKVIVDERFDIEHATIEIV